MESSELVAIKSCGEEISQPHDADSASTSASGPGEEAVEVDEQVEYLTQRPAKLSFADIVPRPAIAFPKELLNGPTWQPEPDPASVCFTLVVVLQLPIRLAAGWVCGGAVGAGSLAEELCPPFLPAAAEPGEPSHIPSIPERSSSTPPPGGSRLAAGQEGVAGASVSLLATSQAPMVSSGMQAVCPFPLLDAPDRPTENDELTTKIVNRKRVHSDLSDDDASRPVTPSTNKRRNLGPPGSTPFARRLPPLSRRLSTNAAPYSERRRRRAVESQGRIHRTLFRLPQLIAQTEADRQAAETLTQSGPCPPPLPQMDFEVPAAQEKEKKYNESLQTESLAPQEPAAPETPPRGWNIRGLLNSVPRSFSRFIPTFGRSSSRSESPSAPSSSTPITSQLAPVQTSRTAAPQTETVTSRSEERPRRRQSEQPPKKRARNLTYSLFPAPMDKSLYLGDIPKTPRSLSQPSLVEPLPVEQSTQQELTAQIATESEAKVTETGGRDVLQETSVSEQKKRKRSPSPDVIPNPVGASYGMDLDYFCYSSESDDEAATPQLSAPTPADGLAKAAMRSALRSERPSSKKVRFDASPEDTPSKLRYRARATDPYLGKHFIGIGSGSPASASAPASPTPTTPTPSTRIDETPQRPPGFIPNTQGTFQLDYDAFSDDSSESSGPSSSLSIPAPSPVAEGETRPAPQVTEPESLFYSISVLSPASRRMPPAPPLTPAKVDEEALAKARSQAEKYKPKTPSGLRTTSRYSSPLTITPDIQAEIVSVQKFGDDKFAQDAQWLYENCPSGDLRQLAWPAKKSLQESLGISQTAVDIVNQVWKESEVDKAYCIFREGLEEFKRNKT
ncbi:uncharacterized protein ATNIH1004_007863 [Aspergillus tanneri]|uniref:Uncharacterized protein n=1 Tax=Aspergillus tanneri TaxID=1220188 RepID=A0A5M9MNB6_9EURO|nr:uncharacterized protein ATNIH1004_007863 [Aspergillus tanneri]KAA8646433.1 hypothetical protein ATNIH1004_007863 [Aspergillus tanneri]